MARPALLSAWLAGVLLCLGAHSPTHAAKPAGRDHWAFRAIRRPKVPEVVSRAWARNPIDHFVLARLEKEHIPPSPEADRVTLIRRLSLDLLGLPPSPAEIDAFVADPRPDASERLVDRLLASPHYGERWGRHWLDAARYADSDGYNADAARPIWKYRDWVINALNRDLPFDQFTIEQIAGDLLPSATVEQKIATGFHRNTLFNAEGGNDPEEFRVERVADRVGTTGAVFLGLTLGCAECHSHKFDPISLREFYEVFAFFNNADERTLEVPTPEELARRNVYRGEVARLQAQLARHDLDLLSNRTVTPGCAPHVTLLLDAYHVAAPARRQLAAQLAPLKKKEPAVTKTLVLGERAKPLTTHIHLRGDFRRPGAAVTPNVPRILPPLQAKKPTRLDFARWLVSPENPLTARVLVNRVWQQHFGVGLVETENDFGTQGTPPTHPELLDWLASELMAPSPRPSPPGGEGGVRGGWSLKALHRLIVTSATYRQSSNQRHDLAAVDPRNQLLARQVRLRLEAEVIRDVMLSAGGLLCTTIGGPSVFPYQAPGVMELRRAPVPWVMSKGPARHRRGLYTHFWRTSPHPYLVTFDAPRSEAACTRRHRSNTPLQALMTLNDPAFVECARGLATRLLREAKDEDRLQHAFRLCLARAPTATERRVLDEFLARQRQEFGADPQAARKLAGLAVAGKTDVQEFAAWTALARVLLNLDEFITRE